MNGHYFKEKLDRGGIPLHIDAVNHIDAMLEVSGITTLVIGANDLSGSLSLPGQHRHPQVPAIDRVIAAGGRAGLPAGIGIGNDAAVINEWVTKGMWYVAMVTGVNLSAGRVALQVADPVSAYIHYLPPREKTATGA